MALQTINDGDTGAQASAKIIANDNENAAAAAAAATLAAGKSDADHGHDNATTGTPGFMSASDKEKLNSLTAAPAPSTFTGNTLPVNNVLGAYQIPASGSGNSSANYLIGPSPVRGAYGIIRVNRETAPTLPAGSVRITGSVFQPNTNMDLYYRYNGHYIEFFFNSLT